MGKDVAKIINNAKFMARHLRGCDLRSKVIAILFDLRISTNGNGFDYTKNAVIKRSMEPMAPTVKGIYAAVGLLYDPTVEEQLIEHNIRYAIRSAWNTRDEDTWSGYFMPENDRPSNEKFISTIAVFLDMMDGCGKGGNNGRK